MTYKTFPVEPGSIEVIGGTNPGEKAAFLREYQPLAEENGFYLPPTVVLASELLEPTRDKLRNGDDVRVEEEAARALGIFASCEYSPFAIVRSSATADGRGTGVYESVVAKPHWSRLHSAVLEVLRSADTYGAQAFREQVNARDEIAVMLQPLVGQWIEFYAGEASFSPIFSGTAFTSTGREKEGVINIVPGFGGGVTERGALQLTSGVIEEARNTLVYTLNNWEDENRVRITDILRSAKQSHKLSGRRTAFYNPGYTDDNYEGCVFYDDFDGLARTSFCESYLYYGEEKDGSLVFSSSAEYPEVITSFGRGLKKFSPERFMETLSKLEARAGLPLYLEWAMTMRDEQNPDFWLLQIAPVAERILPAPEQVDFDKAYFHAIGVIGNGIKNASKMVIVNNPSDVEQLHHYNSDPENEGYVLVYTSRVTTSIARGYKRLGWEDCYRAGVILEWQDADHTSGTTPLEHIQGAVDVTGKFFGVIDLRKRRQQYYDTDLENYIKWRAPANVGCSSDSYLEVLEDDLTVVADEKSDTLTVGKATK